MIAAGNLSLGARKSTMVQTTNGPGALTPKAALTSTIMKGSKMAAKAYTPAPSAEQARALLRYNPETGKLFWRERGLEHFQSRSSHSVWNSRYADREAFTSTVTGYLCGRIFEVRYYAHRIIWLMQTGAWPEDQIDHINGDRKDNRWVNLRSVSRLQNQKNQKRNRRNTSGVNGVHWHAAAQKWNARIQVDGRYINLGCFESLDEARAAREAANREHGFSDRHGYDFIGDVTEEATYGG